MCRVHHKDSEQHVVGGDSGNEPKIPTGQKDDPENNCGCLIISNPLLLMRLRLWQRRWVPARENGASYLQQQSHTHV
jgi:hypothetical protein